MASPREFEGFVEYVTTYEVIDERFPVEDVIRQMGVLSTLYYKEGNIRIEHKDADTLWSIYRQSDNHEYTLLKGQDRLLYFDCGAPAVVKTYPRKEKVSWHMTKSTSLLCLVLILGTPSFAEIVATNTCAGQPSATASDFGDQTIAPAIPIGATDTLTTGSCLDASGPDSVWCFVAESSCDASFELLPATTDIAGIIVYVQDAGSQCLDFPFMPCAASAWGVDPGIAAVTVPVTIPARSLVCVYGLVTGAPGTGVFTTDGLAGCGALPVELQSYAIDPERESQE